MDVFEWVSSFLSDRCPGLIHSLTNAHQDSWFLWHPLLRSSKLVTRATLVAVDLPNYGGSDSVDVMDASTLLNALAEFTIAMRQRFLPDDDGNSPSKGRVIL